MRIYVLILILISTIEIKGIVVNGYARVTSISSNTVNVTSVNEVNDTFEDGEYVVIMQMQDWVIGGNTLNNASFGNLSAIQSAGLYEIVQIQSHTEAGGIPTSFVFSTGFVNTYNLWTNSHVQIISFRKLGSPNYTLSSVINPIAWNGNIGGVVAFEVSGTLTLANNIIASGYGFRGGIKNLGGAVGCSPNTYINNTGANFADKGEGIYRINTGVNPNFVAGRGKILNGGGGGNSHNAGGGGGSNCSAGGDGGPGADIPYCIPSAGGIGGIALGPYINVNRIFMGGGGGSGEGNEGNATAGGNGGGIILVKANTITTTGGTNVYSISANGNSVTFPSFADGSGGGGGGGSIIIQTNNWMIATNDTVRVNVNGGDGGNVQSPFIHGGGGGGGVGSIFISSIFPGNVVQSAQPGKGGKSNDPVTLYANDGMAGACIDIASGVLPIELIEFYGKRYEDIVRLYWSTASELNNDHFKIMRADDAVNFENIGVMPGQGNSYTKKEYSFNDISPIEGINYYRLDQYDKDGSLTKSKIISVRYSKEGTIKIYPNPARDYVTVEGLNRLNDMRMFNMLGEDVMRNVLIAEQTINIEKLPEGIYVIVIDNEVFKFKKD